MLRASFKLLLLAFATFVCCCCWFITRPVTSLDEMNDDASFLFSVMLSRLSTVHWIYIWIFVCVRVCVKACLSVGKRGKLMEFFSTILQNWMKIVIFKHFHLYLALLLLLLLLSFFASSTSLAFLPTTRSRLHWAICILLLYILCIW